MKYLIIVIPFLLAGCQSVISGKNLPKTLGEENSSYSYIPVDPIPVETQLGASCKQNEETFKSLSEARIRSVGEQQFEKLPQAFPDNTVRIAYKTIDIDGNISFGPVQTAQKNSRYQIIIDFINSDVANKGFYISKFAYPIDNTSNREQFLPFRKLPSDKYPAENVHYEVLTEEEFFSNVKKEDAWGYRPFNVPVYIGVGLRITADITTVKGKTDISGLGPIAAAAENGYVSGSLLVQTLGINGKAITAALPIQSDLNPTTVQNAIVAIGQIKALMYQDETTLKPRVLGIYNPLGGGEAVVNAFITSLSAQRATWYRPCSVVKAVATPSN